MILKLREMKLGRENPTVSHKECDNSPLHTSEVSFLLYFMRISIFHPEYKIYMKLWTCNNTSCPSVYLFLYILYLYITSPSFCSFCMVLRSNVPWFADTELNYLKNLLCNWTERWDSSFLLFCQESGDNSHLT